MPNLIDFIPVDVQTIDTIRARLDADVNAGLLPTDPGFIDTTPGGFYWDLTQTPALEIERLYDFASVDLPASMFVGYAWGEYLDEHGAVLGVARLDAVAATGTATFVGTVGTLIASGTQVATTQTDPDADPVEFATTSSGTIGAGGSLTLPIACTDTGTQGNVAAGTINVPVSSINNLVSVSNGAATSGGADIESDEAYRKRIVLEYQTAQGAGSVGDYERWALAYPGVGGVKVVPIWAGPGTVRVVVTDNQNNPVSQTVIDGLQQQLDPIAASTTLSAGATLPAATLSVANTAGFLSSGSVVVAQGQIVQYTGKTGTTFTGCSGGTGTIASGQPVVQHGLGGGQAPIGAIVIVATPALVPVAVAATVAFESGYSLDGAAGTIPTRAELQDAVAAYLGALAPGDDVIILNVSAQFFLVPGVLDVTALTLNRGSGAVAANVAIADTEVASAGTIALS